MAPKRVLFGWASLAKDREYELKFDVADTGPDEIFRHRLLTGTAQHQERLVSTYFDTPRGHLRRRAIALRVRRTDAGSVQTLKSQNVSLVDRNEWEAPCPSESPQADWLRRIPLASVFSDTIIEALNPVFTVDVTRTSGKVVAKGLTVEAAFDEGVIWAGSRQVRVREFELELKAGTPAALLRFARRLVRDLPLTLSLEPKSERGYALAAGRAARPEKTIHLDLPPRVTLQDAFSGALEASLKVCVHNARLIDGSDGEDEAIHKTRIALRHIRALLQLFRPVLRRKKLQPVLQELKAIARLMGEARDRDVFRDMVRQNGDPALSRLLVPARAASHEKLQAMLGSRRWRVLLLDLLDLAADGLKRRHRRPKFRRFVRQALDTHQRRLAREAKHIRRRPPGPMHDVRKAAKMLRYDLDLFEGLAAHVGRKRFQAVRAALTRLQETLGIIHDHEAFGAHLGTLVAEAKGQPHAADAAFAAGQLAARPIDRARLLAQAAKAAKVLRRTRPF